MAEVTTIPTVQIPPTVYMPNGNSSTGADGTLIIATGTTNIDCGNANYVIKNYGAINISSGATLGFSNVPANGCIVELRCTSFTNAGTVAGNNLVSATAQYCGTTTEDLLHSTTVKKVRESSSIKVMPGVKCNSGAQTGGSDGGTSGGGGGGVGGTPASMPGTWLFPSSSQGGAASGSIGSAGNFGLYSGYSAANGGLASGTTGGAGGSAVGSYPAGGGGGGGAGHAGGHGYANGGGTSGVGGTAGASGTHAYGGGLAIIIYCMGTFDNTNGIITVAGGAGGAGGNGGNGTTGGGSDSTGGCGGGGGGIGGNGGSGGWIIILANKIVAQGTLSAAGGVGGAGGNGGNGSNGAGQSAGGGGAGAAGAGGLGGINGFVLVMQQGNLTV